jgi:hypothetical protein
MNDYIPQPIVTREPQYAACFAEPPVTLGPMIGSTWRWNPDRLSFVAARYRFVAQHVKGLGRVAEIGCADGFMSEIVRRKVIKLDLFDFDPVWKNYEPRITTWDILDGPLWKAIPGVRFDAVYMVDVLEHIRPSSEPRCMRHICASLISDGIFIAGVPSLEAQQHAADISKAGHVNCRSGEQLKSDMRGYFKNVFLFTMNDEMIGSNFPQMAHYLFVICCGPRKDGWYSPDRDEHDVTNGNGDG